MFDLTGKIALITGGGSGIGRAISLLFAKQGAMIFILDIDDTAAVDTVTAIRSEDGWAEYIACSIADENQVTNAISKILQMFNRIDMVVNNAGIAHVATIEQTTGADLERLIAVNIKGVFHVIKAALPALKKQRGVILNMASIASLVGLADRFGYSLTKAAVNGITLSIARDYLSDGIRCNSISPARVHTPFVDGFIAKNYPGKESEIFEKLSKSQPIGRMAKPEEIASLALYLCSDEAAFITGCDYPIDGGFIHLNT